jgi:hypothetical protein
MKKPFKSASVWFRNMPFFWDEHQTVAAIAVPANDVSGTYGACLGTEHWSLFLWGSHPKHQPTFSQQMAVY